MKIELLIVNIIVVGPPAGAENALLWVIFDIYGQI